MAKMDSIAGHTLSCTVRPRSLMIVCLWKWDWVERVYAVSAERQTVSTVLRTGVRSWLQVMALVSLTLLLLQDYMAVLWNIAVHKTGNWELMI